MLLSEQLHTALLDFGAIEKHVSTASLRQGTDAKHALVRSRRELAEQIGRLGPLIEQDEDLAKEPDMQREISRLFAGIRYALVLHQADWPVVRIDEDPAAYRTSARGVEAKSEIFWRWCRAQLGVDNRQVAPES
jgi:hypothetical protein